MVGAVTASVEAFDRQVQDIDRRLVRIETFTQAAGVRRKLPKAD